MRKDFGPQSQLFPMPVLIIGPYDENGKANAMNAAWGAIYQNTTRIPLPQIINKVEDELEK